jgi:hypothetical protein
VEAPSVTSRSGRGRKAKENNPTEKNLLDEKRTLDGTGRGRTAMTSRAISQGRETFIAELTALLSMRLNQSMLLIVRSNVNMTLQSIAFTKPKNIAVIPCMVTNKCWELHFGCCPTSVPGEPPFHVPVPQ